MPSSRRQLRVTGVVQGVGFRPFVFATATALGLTGLVGNDGDGVFIEVQGDDLALEQFVARLTAEAPALASIDTVTITPMAIQEEDAFAIVASTA